MPARRGPRADQIDQGNATSGQIITAGLLFPSFDDNQGSAGTAQDIIQPQAIADVDELVDTPLSLEPRDADSAILFLNGVTQVQGVGFDYELVIDTNGNTSILWLAGSGTAVNLSSTDVIIVLYQVAV